MEQPGFWDHQESAQKVVQELKQLRAKTEPVQALLRKAEDAEVLIELSDESGDAAAASEVEKELTELIAQTDRVELLTLLSGKNDARACFLSIQAGAGGVESCDF